MQYRMVQYLQVSDLFDCEYSDICDAIRATGWHLEDDAELYLVTAIALRLVLQNSKLVKLTDRLQNLPPTTLINLS